MVCGVSETGPYSPQGNTFTADSATQTLQQAAAAVANARAKLAQRGADGLDALDEKVAAELNAAVEHAIGAAPPSSWVPTCC